MKETTTLTPEITETPLTQDVVSEVVEKKEGEKSTKVVEETKKEFLKQSWPLSYQETKKMEKEFEKIFTDLTPEWVLKKLQNNMPDAFKDTKNIEDSLTILKEGKDGEDKNLELGKNENLYHWLKENIKEKNKKEHIDELKQELQKDKKPIVEQILKDTEKEELKWKQIKHKTRSQDDLDMITDYNKKEEERAKRKKEKSESKLWKVTKNVINRPLKHTWTWLGKYLIKKPIDWIRKLFKK